MKRRNFIKLSSLGATSSLLVPNLFAQKATNNPVKIAICGLGNYAQKWIAPVVYEKDFKEKIMGTPIHKSFKPYSPSNNTEQGNIFF